MSGAGELLATNKWIVAKHTQRVGKSANCRVLGRRRADPEHDPVDVRRVVTVGGKRGTKRYMHSVLIGVYRKPFLYDSDARREHITRVVGGVKTVFPVQIGTFANGSWLLTPVACSCKDWLYRGTDSAGPVEPSLRNASITHRERIKLDENTVMGALRGCKHMIAVAREMATSDGR
tara:strand:+ start:2253 stop:2780 length:528 start_codon:yes stop_codon:yes gene_type:complete